MSSDYRLSTGSILTAWTDFCAAANRYHLAAFKVGPGLVEMVEPGSGRKVFVASEPVVAADDVVPVKEVSSPNGRPGKVMMKLSDAGAQFHEACALCSEAIAQIQASSLSDLSPAGC